MHWSWFSGFALAQATRSTVKKGCQHSTSFSNFRAGIRPWLCLLCHSDSAWTATSLKHMNKTNAKEHLLVLKLIYHLLSRSVKALQWSSKLETQCWLCQNTIILHNKRKTQLRNCKIANERTWSFGRLCVRRWWYATLQPASRVGTWIHKTMHIARRNSKTARMITSTQHIENYVQEPVMHVFGIRTKSSRQVG